MPVVTVGDVSQPSAPAPSRTFRSGGTAAGAAASYAQFTLFNNGANLVRMRDVFLDSLTAEIFLTLSRQEGTWAAPGFPSFANAFPTDPRAVEGAGAVLGYHAVTALPTGNIAGALRLGTSQALYDLSDIYILPGQVFSLTSFTVNTTFYGHFRWQEFTLP